MARASSAMDFTSLLDLSDWQRAIAAWVFASGSIGVAPFFFEGAGIDWLCAIKLSSTPDNTSDALSRASSSVSVSGTIDTGFLDREGDALAATVEEIPAFVRAAARAATDDGSRIPNPESRVGADPWQTLSGWGR